MDHFPIFLALQNRRALLIGGNPLAARKAALIAKSGTRITVLAPEFSDAMQALAWDNSRVILSQQSFSEDSLDGVVLVLAATDDDALNRRVYAAANARGIPVNIADQPELCSYILPAIVDRAPVIVAVSTGGRSPVLARYVKALLERALPQSLGRFASLLKRWRQPVKDAIGNEKQRRRFWENQINGAVGESARQGHLDEAEVLLQRALTNAETPSKIGRLTLVGCPSFDPELLSIKAHRHIQTAEWIFYDNDTPDALLELGRREAQTYNVDRADHSDTMQMLLDKHSRGQRVVRLYGRDSELEQEATAERLLFAKHEIRTIILPSASINSAFSDLVLSDSSAAFQQHNYS